MAHKPKRDIFTFTLSVLLIFSIFVTKDTQVQGMTTTTTTTTMQALGAQEHGEWRHVLRVQDVARPTPGPLECLVRVAFADVNPVDLQKLGQNKGQPVKNTDCMIPGYAGSGIVVQVGTSVPPETAATLVPLTTRVAFLVNPATQKGTYAEYCVVDYRAMAVVPDNVSLQSAAVLPLAGCTAYESLVKLGLGPDANVSSSSSSTSESISNAKVLIVGGAGGVGSWAILLLQAWHGNSIEIIATASSEASKAWCQGLDAQKCVQCIGHDNIRSLGGGPKGSVDYILCLTEPTAPTFDAISEVIKPRGCICLVGSGPSLQSLNVGFCFFKGCCLQMETVFSSFRNNFAHVVPANEMVEILALLQSGKIAAAPLSPALSNAAQHDWTNMNGHEQTVLDMISTGHTQGKLCIAIAKDLA